MKKGKLTQTELACIKGMISEDVSLDDMCTQLDRSDILVGKAVNSIKSEAVREQLFINKTASGSKGISVMTEAGSVRGDTAKDRESSAPKKTRSPWVHTIKSNG